MIMGRCARNCLSRFLLLPALQMLPKSDRCHAGICHWNCRARVSPGPMSSWVFIGFSILLCFALNSSSTSALLSLSIFLVFVIPGLTFVVVPDDGCFCHFCFQNCHLFHLHCAWLIFFLPAFLFLFINRPFTGLYIFLSLPFVFMRLANFLVNFWWWRYCQFKKPKLFSKYLPKEFLDIPLEIVYNV